MVTAAEHKTRQLAQWSAAAETWDRRFEWSSQAFHPLIAWCVDAVGARPGMRVLDVACGVGQPALTMAARVGPTGEVVAVDLSREMLAHAARRAGRLRMDHLTFLEMDAEDLRFEDGTFDAVTCTLGLMFCPDAARVAAHMARVLKSGGRCAVAVWDEPARNPFITVGGQAVAEFFPATPPDPSAPGAFRFAQASVLADVLRTAGFRDVSVESRPMTIEFDTADDYWQVFSDLAAGIRARVASMTDADRVRLTTVVRESAQAHVQDGRFRLIATPLCATARK